MSKPRTKGDMIGIRLSLELDGAVRAEADKRDMSPAQYLERVVASVLNKPPRARGQATSRKKSATPRDSSATPAPTTPPEPAAKVCLHKNTKIIAGGLKHCDDCDSTTNMRGEWPS